MMSSVFTFRISGCVTMAVQEEHLRAGLSELGSSTVVGSKRKTVSFFGHFGPGNFGNEGTLQAILYHLHRFLPDAKVRCICTDPEATTAMHNIAAVPISSAIVKLWTPRNPLARMLRRISIGVPSELYRWLKALMTLTGTDVLIIPGTGLLTDAYGLAGWGPYNMFKWSLIAKLCRCKVLFVSVGAGPLYSVLSRLFVKSALSLADFRSYRDKSTVRYLESIGFRTNNDRVFPDLAFSLPEAVIPHEDTTKRHRSVVGLGLMQYAGRYSVERPSTATYLSYLESLVILVRWLLAREYDIRLLIGDPWDQPVVQEFRSLLKERISEYDERRIIHEPVVSVEQLLSQLAATDIVVATRFHNVLFALLANKPVISIAFHHKCVSLMNNMGLSKYSQDINYLSADRLIEQFCDLEKNAEMLKPLIGQMAEQCRAALDVQYNVIFKEFLGSAGERRSAR
jgi:polysaccharide pyruvyl transferase WcaK-like protein